MNIQISRRSRKRSESNRKNARKYKKYAWNDMGNIYETCRTNTRNTYEIMRTYLFWPNEPINKKTCLLNFDLDSHLQTSEFECIRSFRRGIRIFGHQDVFVESNKNVPYTKKHVLISFRIFWVLLVIWVTCLLTVSIVFQNCPVAIHWPACGGAGRMT